MARTTEIGAIVKSARLTAGWSQAALGRAAGIPQSHVAKIEGGADLRSTTLLRILRVLGFDVRLQPNTRGLFLRPPAGSRLAAARAFGVDLGQLFDAYMMSPSQRLDTAAQNAEGLADLLR